MNKIARFFEEHVEKMVLIVVGLVCAWLLITRVIFSPNMVQVGDRKLSPSAIDDAIYQEALDLQRQTTGPAVAIEPYKPRLPEFAKLLDSAIPDIDIDLKTVAPPPTDTTKFAKGVYRLPEIGEVTDVKANLISAVAYVPLDEVTPENTYDKVTKEPNDLDLVSVEAKIDVQRIYENFGANFRDNVEEIYADPCLAKPIFAKVQLQRQQLNDDGTWSAWQEVARARIDQNRQLFNIGEKVGDLPTGGLEVLKLNFGYKQTQIDLLQPQPYQFASAREEWFPPSLHGEYADFQQKERAEELRKQREDEKEARERERDTRGGRRGDTAYGPGGTGAVGQSSRRGGGAYDQYGGGGAYGGTSTRGGRGNRGRDSVGSRQGGTGLPGDTGITGGRRRGSGRRSTTGGDLADPLYGPGGMEGLPGTIGTQRGPRRPTVNDVYRKYDEIALTRLTEFSRIREPLMFWAHDDTVEPENTYRYRIRVGVFNPVAGRNQLDERDKDRTDQAILWSRFSDTTEPIEIMGRIYFFAKNVREGDKAVTVQVSKLTLGRWYSHDFFPVNQGELVGESLEYVPPEEPDRRTALGLGGVRDPGTAVLGTLGPGMSRATGPGVAPGARLTPFGGSQNTSNIPDYIDYSTGAVMVDAVLVSDWVPGRTMRERHYYDMLYSFDGVNILHMPVGNANWPRHLKDRFSMVGRLEREPQEAFKAFGQAGTRRGGQYEMGGYEDMMYEDGYYDDMGGMY